MLSIKDVILLEDLDPENLYWKVNMWYGRDDIQRNSFWTFMQKVIAENPTTLDDLNRLLDSCGITWRGFVQFAMDNVDGTQNFDQLYVMKKIIDVLKANKTLNWEIKDETTT